MPLTEAEVVFIERYLATSDPVVALIDAGLDGETSFPAVVVASKLLRRPDILDAVKVGRKVRDTLALTLMEQPSREAQLAKLDSIYRECRERGKASDAIKAVETQSKLLGMMVEKHEVSMGRKNPEDMSITEMKAEAHALMQEMRKRVDEDAPQPDDDVSGMIEMTAEDITDEVEARRLDDEDAGGEQASDGSKDE